MGKYWCMCELFLELVECCAAFAIEVPQGILLCQMSERNGDFGVSIDEPAVEVGKAKEGLNVFDFPRFQPIEDGLHFVFSNAESVGGKDVSEVFHTVLVKLTFSGICVEAVFLEPAEDFFFDVLFVLRHVVGVDDDVVEVDDDTDIEEVTEDVVHETLKGCRGIEKSKRHHQPFK